MNRTRLVDDGNLHQAWGSWPRCGVLSRHVLDTDDPDEITCPRCTAKMEAEMEAEGWKDA